MKTIVTFLIKGILGLIWLLATIITSVILSPFILIAWISKIAGKKNTNAPQAQANEVRAAQAIEYNLAKGAALPVFESAGFNRSL